MDFDQIINVPTLVNILRFWAIFNVVNCQILKKQPSHIVTLFPLPRNEKQQSEKDKNNKIMREGGEKEVEVE